MYLFTSKHLFALLLLGQSFADTYGPVLSFCRPSYRTLASSLADLSSLDLKVDDDPDRKLRDAAHRDLNGWFPCGNNTHCVIDRATCAVDDKDMGTCTCMDGYGGTECRPVNECETDFPCPGGSVCVDMDPPDRFKCDCKKGFTPFLPNALPNEPNVTLANRPISCIDNDECADTEDPPCHPDATCTNAIGGVECVCNGDLVGNGKTTCTEPSQVETTTEVECSVSTDCQGSNMQCVNATCSCLPGYAQVGPNCQNEVHCDIGGFNNDCHRRATCTEEDDFPGFSCDCIEGWEDAFEGANGKSCKDIPPVTEAPPEPTVETTTLPEGVGPHPNRPTVFPPKCLADGAQCGDGNPTPCCAGTTCVSPFRRVLLEADEKEITTEEVHRVLQAIQGDPDGYFAAKDSIISEASIQALKEELDDAYANNDFDPSKIPQWRLVDNNLPPRAQLNHKISGDKLIELIGKDEAGLLLDYFHEIHGENAPVTSIKLQLSHNDEMIYFSAHKDNKASLIVFLGREDFERGGLGYYTKDGYIMIPAAKGKAITHGPLTVHQSEPFKGWRHILDIQSLGEGNDCILEKHLL